MATVTELLDAAKELLKYSERQTCLHGDLYRAGAIWTICPNCGKKWADDEGGFVPDEEPKEITNMRNILDDLGDYRG